MFYHMQNSIPLSGHSQRSEDRLKRRAIAQNESILRIFFPYLNLSFGLWLPRIFFPYLNFSFGLWLPDLQSLRWQLLGSYYALSPNPNMNVLVYSYS